MSDCKDSAIKLFGKTIPLQLAGDALQPNLVRGGGGGVGDEEKDAKENDSSHGCKKQVQDCSDTKENSPPANQENSDDDEEKTIDSSTCEEQNIENSSTQKDKMLKKPDKILPCPRCNSMDTKFCYYNNYNVNQPRHFCKKCQRYWTAGGAMRNVPVGAGRRKSKNSASHYRHISIADPSLQAIRADVVESALRYPLKPNRAVLSFGSDKPLSDTVASVLKLAERTLKNGNRNGLEPVEEKVVTLSCATENCHETVNSNAKMVAETNLRTSPMIPYVNGSSWPYGSPPIAPYCASNFPIPAFYPAATYWTCAIPLLSPMASSPTNHANANSQTLGKHSRDGNGNTQKECNREEDRDSHLWVPKTLRIDDPNEAAKSSIWTIVGAKNDKPNSATGIGLFSAFQPKVNPGTNTPEASRLFGANPVALARSLSFQESS